MSHRPVLVAHARSNAEEVEARLHPFGVGDLASERNLAARCHSGNLEDILQHGINLTEEPSSEK